MARRILSFLLILVAACSVLRAQRNEDIVHLDHADSLIGREIDGEKVRELVGNVRFSQGRILVNCMHAIQYMSRNRIELEGEVAVRDDSLTLFANRGVYYSDSKTAEGFDRVRLNDRVTYIDAGYGIYHTETGKAFFRYNVHVEDTASTLASDELTYFRREQRLIADGNVVLTNPANSVTIHGGHFEHDKIAGTSVMTVAPHAVQVDTSEGGVIDSLVVSGRMLESYQDTIRRLVATDSVVIIRSDFSGECGLATFLTGLDSIEMFRNPFIWYSSGEGETTQVAGDSIFVKLHERIIDHMLVRGSAMAISQADSSFPSKFHQLTGQELQLAFVDRQVSRIDVDRNASMVYFLFEDGSPNGLNTTSGDHVAITFENRKINTITVTGGVEGRYVPERLLAQREAEFNLPGFNWKERRPRRPD